MAEDVEFVAEGVTCEGIGAQVWAFLAYPEGPSTKRRGVELRLRGRLLAHRISQGPWRHPPLTEAQLDALHWYETSRGGVDHLWARLRRRMDAGNVACALLLDALGLSVGFPAGFGEPTLANGLKWITGGADDVRNVERRVWDESWAALNLAAALCYLLKQRQRDALAPDSILELGFDAAFIGSWIEAANLLGPAIEQRWPRRATSRRQPHFVLAPEPAQNVTVSA